MIIWLYRIAVIALMAVGYTASALAIGGAEYTDRPSSRLPTAPNYTPGKDSEGFSLPPVPEPPPGTMDDRRRLFIQKIVLHGNHVFSEQELRTDPAIDLPSYEGREVSLADLYELRDKITRHYINDKKRYINSGARFPAEPYRDGELHIDIVEGRLNEIHLKGLERLHEDYVKSRLWDDENQAFNLQALEDNYQLLLADDKLISRMNGRVLPGNAPGQGMLDIDVTRKKPPFQLSLFGDNQRPPSIGAEAFGLDGSLHNLTGWGDTLNFTFITSAGSDRYGGGFNLPIPYSKAQVFFRFDEGDSMVFEEPLRNINIKSQVHSMEGGIRYALWRKFDHSADAVETPVHSLDVGTLLAIRENETNLLDRSFSFVPGEPTGHSQATVWRVFQEYSQWRKQHALILHSSFSVGINALGATPERLSKNPDSEFFAWLGQGQYVYRFQEDGPQR